MDDNDCGKLGFSTLPNETVRNAVKRIAGKYGLQEECLAIFYREVERGSIELEAAWEALCEWDCLDFIGPRSVEQKSDDSR